MCVYKYTHSNTEAATLVFLTLIGLIGSGLHSCVFTYTYAHILLVQFLNCRQEWFIYSTIGCSFLWKLLTDPKEFCVFFKAHQFVLGQKKCECNLSFCQNK